MYHLTMFSFYGKDNNSLKGLILKITWQQPKLMPCEDLQYGNV